MKILLINTVCGIGSTGRICTDLAQVLEQQGHQVKIAYGREAVPEQYKKYAVRIGSDTGVKLHALQARFLDNAAFASTKATENFVQWIKEYDPDVIHLHNLHGYYLDIEVLFAYLKTCGKKLLWTLHDCWAFTGHCAHYSAIGCDKWLSHCRHCPQKHTYPKSVLLDNSYGNFEKKRRLFTGLPDMTLITPSKWLAEQAKRSFLGEYSIYPIPNGVDMEVFQPTDSDLRAKYGLEGKKVLLGVSSVWTDKKGLDDFFRLSAMLDSSYQIVLIGLTEAQQRQAPENILALRLAESPRLLAQWYSTADVFVNPSVEETMGLTTAEALACGTPVITYNKTAVPEVADETCGIAVDCRPERIAEALERLPMDSEACINRAKTFEKNKQYLEYLRLYQGI